MRPDALTTALLLLLSTVASARAAEPSKDVALPAGDAVRLATSTNGSWTSSDPAVAQAFSNGFVIGIKPATRG